MMETRLSAFAERLIEAGWLTAVAAVPLFFNIAARNVFDLSKVALLRSLVLLMVVAGLIRAIEQRVGRESHEIVLSLDPLKQLLVLPALAVGLVTILATLVSVLPHDSLWGSYLRAQGLYTVLAYVLVFFTLRARLRARAQLDRLVTALLWPTFVVAVFALMQGAGYELIPGVNLTQGRMSSTLGNPIFLGAYLIMVMPLTAWRLGQALRHGSGQALRHGSGQALRHSSGQALRHSSGQARSCRRGGVESMIQPALYGLLLFLQGAALVASQSRGPWLGLVAGVVPGVFLWASARRLKRVAWLTMTGVSLLVVFLILLNVPTSPLAPLRSLPYLGRLGTMLDSSGRGIGTGRVWIWRGALDAITADPWRALIGYGPETLRIVFDHYYPVELLQFFKGVPESIDRAHNIILDVTVTTGLVGLLAYLGFVISSFYVGLRCLGVFRSRWGFVRLAAVSIGGGVISALGASAIAGSGDFTGPAMSFGIIASLSAYLFWKAVVEPPGGSEEAGLTARGSLVMALLVAIGAHFSELAAGIPVTDTQLLFWVFAALLAVLATRGRGPAFWEAPGAMPRHESRVGHRRGRTVTQSAASLVSQSFNPWAWGVLAGVALVTLAYGVLVPNAPRSVWALMVVAWLFYGVWMYVESQAGSTGGALRGIGAYALASLGPWLLFTLLHSQALAAIRRNTFEVANLIWLYFFAMLALVMVFARTLVPEVRTRRLWNGGVTVFHPVLVAVAVVLIVTTNLNPMRADAYYKLARTYAEKANTRDRAINAYQHAISLAPDQPLYYFALGRTLLLEAERAGPPADENPYLEPARQALQQAYAMNPQDVTVTLTLAWLYWKWAEFTPDRQTQLARLRTVNQYYQQAAALRPNQGFIYSEWARVRSQLGDEAGAQALRETAQRLGYEKRQKK